MSKTTRPPHKLPSIERLRELLTYDPETGEFCNRIARGSRAPAGALVGKANNMGYRTMFIDWQRLLCSRVAWAMHYGQWPAFEIGHRDGNRANDAIANLIDKPRPVHHANRQRTDRDSRAPALGIRRKGNRWHARFDGQHLGTFSTIDEAFRAYLAHKASTGKLYRSNSLEA